VGNRREAHMFLYITLDGKRTTVEIKYPPNFEELKQSLAHSLSIRSDETENLKILIKTSQEWYII